MSAWAGRRVSVVLACVAAAGVVVELAVSAWTGTWQVSPIHAAIVILVIHQTTSEWPPSALEPMSGRLLAITNVAAALTVISAVVTWSAASTGERSAAVVVAAAATFFFVGTVARLVRARRGGSSSSGRDVPSPRRAAG